MPVLHLQGPRRSAGRQRAQAETAQLHQVYFESVLPFQLPQLYRMSAPEFLSGVLDAVTGNKDQLFKEQDETRQHAPSPHGAGY